MHTRIAMSAALFVAATASGQAFAWRRAQINYLGSCSIAFDSARHRLFAFAGQLHEWDGDQWLLHSTAHTPGTTSNSQLVYDSARERLVLLQFVPGNSLQVHEFDGDDWVQRVPSGNAPLARLPAASAFDPVRQMVVIFGGRVTPTQALGDTWGWNGTAWAQLSTTGPSARGNSAMAFHPATSRLVLYGGDFGSNETWTFDGTQWSQATPATNPPQFSQHRLATDPNTGTVWMHDGQSGATWTWNGSDWTAGPLLNQSARTEFGFAHDGIGAVVAGGRLLLGTAGGLIPVSGPTGDTWQLQNGAWTLRNAGGPRLGTLGIGAYDESRGRMMLLDGSSSLDMRTWEWTGRRWIDTTKVLPATTGMAMCFDPFRGRILAFGGLRVGGPSFATALADLRAWDGSNWTTMFPPSTPPGRWNAAMAFDPLRGEVVVHGGSAINQLLGDTWTWNGFVWHLAAATGPTPRASHAMAYDAQNGGVLLFGGTNGVAATDETWLWDGSSWAQLQPATVPPGRMGHRLVSSIYAPTPTLLGGYQFTDRWQWTGTDWLRLPGDLASSPTTTVHGVLAAVDNDGNTLFVTSGTTWLGGAGVATIATHGPGCPSGPSLRAIGEPALGNAGFAVDLRRAPASVPYVLAAGAGVTVTPIGNCLLYLPAIDFAVGGRTTTSGDDTARLPVPEVASLLGVEFSLQAAALDPASALGFTLSDGLVGRIGR